MFRTSPVLLLWDRASRSFSSHLRCLSQPEHISTASGLNNPGS